MRTRSRTGRACSLDELPPEPSQLGIQPTVNPHSIPSGSPVALARALWRHKHLLLQLTRREIAQRHRGSVLGALWALLNPLLMLAVYTFVFSVVFQARWGTRQHEAAIPFAIVLFVGLSLHGLLADIVGRAPGLITGQANLVKRVVFPLELLPVVTAAAALFQFGISMSVLLAVQAFLSGPLPLTSLLAPLVVLPLLIVALGLAWFVASIGVFLRDIAPIVTMLLTMLLFLSPVFYPLENLPVAIQPWLLANPLTFVIEQARQVLIWGRQPDWLGLAAYSLAACAIAWAGFAWFQATRKGFADVL